MVMETTSCGCAVCFGEFVMKLRNFDLTLSSDGKQAPSTRVRSQDVAVKTSERQGNFKANGGKPLSMANFTIAKNIVNLASRAFAGRSVVTSRPF